MEQIVSRAEDTGEVQFVQLWGDVSEIFVQELCSPLAGSFMELAFSVLMVC